MKVKKYSKVQENISALVQIFNAIPSSLFSAAAELAALRHPRRPTQSDSLEERFGKAKSSMPLRHFPAPSIYHITSLWDNFDLLIKKSRDFSLIIQDICFAGEK